MRKQPQIIAVASSMLYAVCYDEVTHTLDAVFYRTGPHRYYDVPPTVFKELMAARSIGSFMRDCVIDMYPWEPLRGPTERARR